MKNLLKAYVRFLAVVSVSPLLLLYWIIGARLRQDMFAAFSQFLSLFPGKLGSYIRIGFYRFTMTACDPDCFIGFGTIFSHADTNIGSGTYIGPQSNIGMCEIGCNTLIASGVHIVSGREQHHFSDLQIPIQQQGGVFIKVSIGEDSWIGNGAIVMADVGRKCIIGAGSVVTKAIPDYSIAVGNPASVIRSRLDLK
ncbi:acyltransferase [Halochromatium roseum]|uniref:acyltransferase n=1 Tax=Halochromatium roseum TaxID=391920 RepID=UPI001913F1AF|nr:acyltransferase [Halochromatium roseum]MBK5940375.1 acetyltransferase [Halochromatium roseum]